MGNAREQVALELYLALVCTERWVLKENQRVFNRKSVQSKECLIESQCNPRLLSILSWKLLYVFDVTAISHNIPGKSVQNLLAYSVF